MSTVDMNLKNENWKSIVQDVCSIFLKINSFYVLKLFRKNLNLIDYLFRLNFELYYVYPYFKIYSVVRNKHLFCWKLFYYIGTFSFTINEKSKESI